jgi:hypothetical protein
MIPSSQDQLGGLNRAGLTVSGRMCVDISFMTDNL